MSYYHLELDKYADWVVTIHTPSSISGSGSSGGKITELSGIAIDPISIEMGAQTDKIGVVKALENLGQAGLSFLGNAGQAIGAVLSSVTYSVLTSTVQWKGPTTPFEFTTSFIVFETGKNGVGQCDNYNTLTTALARMTQPKEEARKQIFAIQEPTYYNLFDYWKNFLHNDMKYFENSLFMVSIGSHFLASYLIPIRSSVRFSQSLNEMGRPLYATVQLSFQTYRNLTFDEYASMFRR